MNNKMKIITLGVSVLSALLSTPSMAVTKLGATMVNSANVAAANSVAASATGPHARVIPLILAYVIFVGVVCIGWGLWEILRKQGRLLWWRPL